MLCQPPFQLSLVATGVTPDTNSIRSNSIRRFVSFSLCISINPYSCLPNLQKGSLSKWDQMTECLYETLSSLLAPGSSYVPLKFLNFVRKRHPQFEGCDQHDAHELLRHTLDSIKMNDLKVSENGEFLGSYLLCKVNTFRI